MKKHSIYSQDRDKVIGEFDEITPEVKQLIIDHLTENPHDCVEHTIKNTVVDFYEVNPKSGKPSKVILKDSRYFYKPLVDPDLPF